MSKASARVQVYCWFPGYILQCSQATVHTGGSKTKHGEFCDQQLREERK